DPTPARSGDTGLAPSRSADPKPSGTAAPPSGAVPSATPDRSAGEVPPLAVEPVADGLAAPIGIATGPPGWLLVQEQDGRVVALETESGQTEVSLDITDRVLGGGERGLLGLAMHPDFPDDARAFVHYSDRDGHTVLSEFDVTDPANPIVIDPASERVLLRAEQPYANHNGGQLAFGPDGYLWFGLGDGGAGGDPLGNGQNPATLLGSILRLDVSEPGRYAIPADNPFADGSDGAPEVHHWGLRNPWRFSFDRQTGELFVADVGQNAYEEVNRTSGDGGGRNFEWNVREGAHCFAGSDCEPVGVGPWLEYGRDLGCSVTGGHVYRGEAIAGLDGWYLFSDYCSGLLFGACLCMAVDASVMAPEILLETGANVSSFGEDADGELYLADHASGTIYRIVAGD
ncbi:MAG TPA: PQQ-dependent sugar dehydrogenase, partial [Candidatus Limnocylindria bacterium]|nr:PQQ-dependent sugar dehydrogenase [Candidatus Limnocylindria bacterium]